MTSPETIESVVNPEGEKEDTAARLIWEYMKMNHELQKSDVILVLGGGDINLAVRASELYHQGLAPKILFSGSGTIHNDKPGRAEMFKNKTEAEVLARIAEENGVPRDAILIENQSQNTGDNYKFSIEILKQAQVSMEKIITVGHTYSERRAYATAKRWLPESDVRVKSPQTSFEEFMDKNRKKLLDRLVGHLQRVKRYGEPDLNYQIPQEIPKEVWEAGEYLLARGYNGRPLLD